MSVEFGGYGCLAPEMQRDNALRNGYPLEPWYGKANSYRNTLRAVSGRGWILLLRSDLDKLGIDTKADLVFSGDQNKATLTLKNLHAVKAGVICPGKRDAADGACWVEIADRRRLLQAIPIDKAYNVRAAPGSASYYSATLNTGVAWTWTQLVSDIWSTVGTGATKLGAYPGLPFTPDGTPEGFSFYGGASALMALDAVLERLGCALKLDLITDLFSIVRVQTTDATTTAAMDKRDTERIWDAGPQLPTRGKLPQYVRVLFSKQRDTTDTTGGSPYYPLDVADSTTPASVESGTYAVIHDDMPALYAAGVLSNGAGLATRAAERAADWFRIAKQTRVVRTFTGLWSDVGLRPGAELQAEVFEECGDDEMGFRTSILSTDGRYDPRTGDVSGGLAAAVWEDADCDCCPGSLEWFKELEWLAYYPAWFTSLVVKEVDGTPTVTNVSVISTDGSTTGGLYVVDEGGGEARILAREASATQTGTITFSAQQINGHKTFINSYATTGVTFSGIVAGGVDNESSINFEAHDICKVGYFNTAAGTNDSFFVDMGAGDPKLYYGYKGTDVRLELFGVGGAGIFPAVVLYDSALTARNGQSGTDPVGNVFTGGWCTTIGSSGPSTITVANEGTDATCFPLFVTAATGSLGPKSNAALTFNSATANLACTTFTGALVGNADTVTTNANLTGVISSSGNSTSITAQTGTGTTFAMSAGPTFTGVPAAPTAAPGTNTTQIATTAFVTAAVGTPISNTKTNYTGTTTNALVTVFTLTNSSGLHGSFSIKNTHASNGVSYKVTAVDMYGTSRNSGTVPVPVGNVATFCFDTILSTTTAGSPNSSVTLEVIDTSAGNHATYDVYTSVIG